jgi:hypothetical protein
MEEVIRFFEMHHKVTFFMKTLKIRTSLVTHFRLLISIKDLVHIPLYASMNTIIP